MQHIQQLKTGTSISEAIEIISESLRLAGVETSRVDARILLGHVLGLTRAQLLARANRSLEPREIDAVASLVARRLRREPISRILGYREFWNLVLRITPDVFDPRSDTETLIEAVFDFITQSGWRHDRLRILDIGTGSGAILLALLRELPNAVGIATDISQSAIMVARANADSNGLSDRCNFIVCNIAAGLAGPFDVIVSNPPYIQHNEIMILEPEVRDHDPLIALDGSMDGLAAYRAIVQQAKTLLAARGRIFVELGLGQESMVASLFTNAELAVTAARHDLAGIPRVLSADHRGVVRP